MDFIKDTYGFLRAAERKARLFFHFSELRGCTAADLVPGQEVTFTTYTDVARSGKVIGGDVRRMPEGTISYIQRSAERFHGVLEHLPLPASSAPTPPSPAAGAGEAPTALPPPPGVGRISFVGAGMDRRSIEFKEADILSAPSDPDASAPAAGAGPAPAAPVLAVGGEVEFSLAVDRLTGALSALRVAAVRPEVKCGNFVMESAWPFLHGPG